MNTRIDYFYRDLSNYKKFQCVILPGAMSEEQINKITACCPTEQHYFIPWQVGLKEERFNKWTEDDWEWFEFEGAELTEEKADTDIVPDELITRFEEMKPIWGRQWPSFY